MDLDISWSYKFDISPTNHHSYLVFSGISHVDCDLTYLTYTNIKTKPTMYHSGI
jgi:hypothetical protein